MSEETEVHNTSGLDTLNGTLSFTFTQHYTGNDEVENKTHKQYTLVW
jgi:hypothetical protein